LEQKRCSNGISLITIKQLFKMQIWNFGYHWNLELAQSFVRNHSVTFLIQF
jgi:hypothetical protein